MSADSNNDPANYALNLAVGAGSSSTSASGNPDPDVDCSICLEPCVFPVELTCHHTFCYLCLKGAAVQATHQGQKPRCSMCRTDIPLHVLSNPPLKDSSALYKKIPADEYQWYYECRSGGWWQFEERTRKDLELAFAASESTCKLLIAGQMYEVDLGQMIQFRPNNRNAFRRIKRDLSSATLTKGIAGIRIFTGAAQPSPTATSAGNSSNGAPSDGSPSQLQDGSYDGNGNGGPTPGTLSQASPSPLVPPSTIQAIATGNLSAVGDGYDEYDSDEDDEPISQFGNYEGSSDFSDDEDDYSRSEEVYPSGDESEVDPGTPRDGARAPTNRSGDRSGSSIFSNVSQPPVPSTPANDGVPSDPIPSGTATPTPMEAEEETTTHADGAEVVMMED